MSATAPLAPRMGRPGPHGDDAMHDLASGKRQTTMRVCENRKGNVG